MPELTAFEAWLRTLGPYDRSTEEVARLAWKARGAVDARIVRDWHEGRSDGRSLSCEAAILAQSLPEASPSTPQPSPCRCRKGRRGRLCAEYHWKESTR